MLVHLNKGINSSKIDVQSPHLPVIPVTAARTEGYNEHSDNYHLECKSLIKRDSDVLIKKKAQETVRQHNGGK